MADRLKAGACPSPNGDCGTAASRADSRHAGDGSVCGAGVSNRRGCLCTGCAETVSTKTPASAAPRQVRAPSQARAQETRGRILQCAREAFAQHGFSAANVRDIAREAGTTHSMITYHFGTKDQLWRESVRDMFELLRRQVFDVVAAEEFASIEERVRRITTLYARYCAQHPEHARITIAETITGGERLRWMIDEYVRHNHADARWLQELMDAGITPRMPFESLLYAYVGMIQMPFVLAREAELVGNYDFTSDEAIERHAAAVLALLMPGARRNPGEKSS